MDRERLLTLLEAYLEQRLTATDRAELQGLLRAAPAARRLFWEYTQQHALLADLHAEARGVRLAREEHTAVCLPLPRRRRVRLAVWLAASAAAVLLVLSVFLLGGRRDGPPNPPAVAGAELEEVEGEVYLVSAAGKVAAEPKHALRPGQALQTHGEGSYAVVKYPDSTRLEVGPDSTLDLLAAPHAPADAVRKVFLKEGTLTAEVAPQPHGNPMLLATPHAEIASSGNKVSFTSDATTTRIELEEGQAQCVRTRDGKSIAMRTGWYTIATMEDEPFEARPLTLLSTRPRLVLPKALGPVLALAFTPDGDTLVSNGWLGEVRFWDTKTGKVRQTIQAHSREVRALALSTDGRLLATTDDRSVKLWDTVTGSELRSLLGLRFAVRALALAPDGRTLVTAGGGAKKGGAELKLWDTATGSVRATLKGHAREVLAVAFAPDGLTVASAARDRGIRLYDARTGKEKRLLAGHRREALALAFSPDSLTLASGSPDGSVKLWDALAGTERRAFKAHPQKLRALAFSPDGKLLATAGQGQSVKLWDATTGQERGQIRVRRNVGALAFSPDGKTLATGGWGRFVKLWALAGDGGGI